MSSLLGSKKSSITTPKYTDNIQPTNKSNKSTNNKNNDNKSNNNVNNTSNNTNNIDNNNNNNIVDTTARDELIASGINTSNSSTSALKRILRTINDTKPIATSTNIKLEGQTEQIANHIDLSIDQ